MSSIFKIKKENMLHIFLICSLITVFLFVFFKLTVIQPKVENSSHQIYALEKEIQILHQEKEKLPSKDSINTISSQVQHLHKELQSLNSKLMILDQNYVNNILDDKVLIEQSVYFLEMAQTNFLISNSKATTISLLRQALDNLSKSKLPELNYIAKLIIRDRDLVLNYIDPLYQSWSVISEAKQLAKGMKLSVELVKEKKIEKSDSKIKSSIEKLKGLVKINSKNTLKPIFDETEISLINKKTDLLLEELRWFVIKEMQQEFNVILNELKLHTNYYYDQTDESVIAFNKKIETLCGNSATPTRKPTFSSLNYLIKKYKR